MSRPRFALILAMVASLCLALAAGAAAKPHAGKAGKKAPHKAASALSVDAPKSTSLPIGIPAKVKVKVANHGKVPIAEVALLATHSKEVKVTPAKAKVGTLKPHKSKAITFTVTVTAAGKPKLSFIATAPHQPKAHDGIALKTGLPPEKEEAKKAPDIVGRYFWNTYQVLTTTYMHAYYFVDEHWVYRGVPKEGLPACSSQTANGEDDGCLPYTWDESTGALNIAGTTGEYKVGSHGAKVGDESFSEAVLPEAGTKFDLSGSYINQFGICPLSCSFVTVDLQMSSSGEFARASGVSGFFGEGGSYGALPPEDHGTYSIDQHGRIVFYYADAHTVTETIAVMLDNSNNPDPNYGLLLGESAYFGPHSEV
jgi:hypothetical protein